MKLKLDKETTLEIIDNSENGELLSEGSTEIVNELASSIAPIVKFAEQTLTQLRENTTPSELEITFGAEAGGEGGFFGLAKVHAKATISIKMKWVPAVE